ncbi:MAG TPA: UvrB/UvrC motif-containing protein [Chitinivibrionales bacterium]
MNLCEDCGANHATVHVTHIEGENTIVSHLCDECAKKRGISISITLQDPALEEPALSPKNIVEESGVCSACKLPFSEFKTHGRLGCEQCYKSFEKEIDEVLKQLSGSVVHKGKPCPKKFPVSTDVKDIARLKKELDEAVKKEDFERAAALRDAIHALGETNSLHEQHRGTLR